MIDPSDDQEILVIPIKVRGAGKLLPENEYCRFGVEQVASLQL
jgi:hypothetical protein